MEKILTETRFCEGKMITYLMYIKYRAFKELENKDFMYNLTEMFLRLTDKNCEYRDKVLKDCFELEQIEKTDGYYLKMFVTSLFVHSYQQIYVSMNLWYDDFLKLPNVEV